MSEENVELVRRLYPEDDVDMVRLFGNRDRARALEAAGLPEWEEEVPLWTKSGDRITDEE